MKITIDTKEDSKDDISKTIEFLQHLVNEQPKQKIEHEDHEEETAITHEENNQEEAYMHQDNNKEMSQETEENRQEESNKEDRDEEYKSIPIDDEEKHDTIITHEPAEAHEEEPHEPEPQAYVPEQPQKTIQTNTASIITDEDTPTVFQVEKEDLPPLFDEPSEEEKQAAENIMSYD